jgi:uncharacterized protein YndB with AHSA1/START domain
MPKDKVTTKKPAIDKPIPPVEKDILINAGTEQVWAALTDPKAIESWMEDDTAVIELKIGGKYVIFGGETTGYFMEIEKPSTLVYSWRMGDWKKAWADSVVRWELKPQGKKTKVHLTHSEFPNEEQRDSHDEGWDLYFIEPMKAWLEGQ